MDKGHSSACVRVQGLSEELLQTVACLREVCACLCMCSVVSDSLQPRKLQPTRLLCPWDIPGKNIGMGCHFLLQGIFRARIRPNVSYTSCIERWIHLPISHLEKLPLKVLTWFNQTLNIKLFELCLAYNTQSMNISLCYPRFLFYDLLQILRMQKMKKREKLNRSKAISKKTKFSDMGWNFGFYWRNM